MCRRHRERTAKRRRSSSNRVSLPVSFAPGALEAVHECDCNVGSVSVQKLLPFPDRRAARVFKASLVVPNDALGVDQPSNELGPGPRGLADAE
jgi:hypothetical protein